MRDCRLNFIEVLLVDEVLELVLHRPLYLKYSRDLFNVGFHLLVLFSGYEPVSLLPQFVKLFLKNRYMREGALDVLEVLGGVTTLHKVKF